MFFCEQGKLKSIACTMRASVSRNKKNNIKSSGILRSPELPLMLDLPSHFRQSDSSSECSRRNVSFRLWTPRVVVPSLNSRCKNPGTFGSPQTWNHILAWIPIMASICIMLFSFFFWRGRPCLGKESQRKPRGNIGKPTTRSISQATNHQAPSGTFRVAGGAKDVKFGPLARPP